MPENTSPIVYELKAVGNVNGEEMINTWYYAGSAVATDLLALVADFYDHVLDGATTFMSSQAGWNYVNITGVRGTILFDTLVRLAEGLISGDCLPPYASWDFTLVRGGAGERNGYKRFVGVAEASQINGTATGAILANIASHLGDLGATITDGTTVYTPVIRRGTIGHVVQRPPKYYSTSGIIYSKIGTQNSRKFGHGR